MNTEINTNSSGYSSSITLEPGIWNLFVSATNWNSGTANLQVSSDDVIFFNLKDDTDTAIAFTENDVEEINGGVILRVNNDLNISGFYLVAKKAV